jgi:hypothetical protein
MSYIKPQINPALPPDFCHSERRVILVSQFGGSGLTTWKTRGKYSPSDLAGGVSDAWVSLVWLIFFNGYSFLMISPNLLDFWAMFFLILSRYGTLHLLIIFRT